MFFSSWTVDAHSSPMRMSDQKKSNVRSQPCRQCGRKFIRSCDLKKHLETCEQNVQRVAVTHQQEATSCQSSWQQQWPQHELLQLRIEIEPLRMELLQPEIRTKSLQPELPEVKSEPRSDTEEESQPTVSSYNLRGPSKPMPPKVSVASAEISHSKEKSDRELTASKLSQPRKSLFEKMLPASSNVKEPASTNANKPQPTKSLLSSESAVDERSQRRKSLEQSVEESISAIIKRLLPTKSSIGFDDEPAVSKRSQRNNSLEDSEKDSTLSNVKVPRSASIKELKPKNSLRSDKESLVIAIKEPTESPGPHRKPVPLMDLEESPPRKLRRISDKETPLMDLKGSQPSKSRRLLDEKKPLSVNRKESQPGESGRMSDEAWSPGGLKQKPGGASRKAKSLTCEECGLHFRYNDQLRLHLKWHEKMIMDSISYTCNQCGVQYKRISCLKKHIAAVHVTTAILLQSGQAQKNASHRVDSRQQSDEEMGQRNGEERRSAEGIPKDDDRDDEMDHWSNAESDKMFEEDDRRLVAADSQKPSKIVATACPSSDVRDLEEVCQTARRSQVSNAKAPLTDTRLQAYPAITQAANSQMTRESNEPNAKTAIADWKARTRRQVATAPRELHSGSPLTRRSLRMSSDAYIHKILYGDSRLRRSNASRQENRESIGQDGLRTGEKDSSVIGQKDEAAQKNSAGESDRRRVGTGQSGQQNSSGKIDKLDTNSDVENGESGEQAIEEILDGDLSKERQPISRSSASKGNYTSQVARRTVDGVTRCYKETIYPCPECGVEFTRPLHLASHRITKHSQGVHGCTVCASLHETPDELRSHMLVNHKQDLPDENVEEGQTAANGSNEKPVDCNICGRKLATMSNLQKHLLTHEKKTEPEKPAESGPFACDVCGLLYLSRSTLRRHQLSHERKEMRRKREWYGKVVGNKIVILDSVQYNKERNLEGVDSKGSLGGKDGAVENAGRIKEEVQNELEKSEQNGDRTVELNCTDETEVTENAGGENEVKREDVKDGVVVITPSVDQLVKKINRREYSLSVLPTDAKLEDLVEGTPRTCNISGPRRNDPEQMERQSKIAGEEKIKRGTFLCDECGMEYKCLGYLERHQLTHIVEKSRVQCAEVPKESVVDDMIDGIPLAEIVTISEESQKAMLGDESMDDKSAIDKTLIQYNTFYICDDCGTKFEQAKDLLRHKLEHRRGTASRRYNCEECGGRYDCMSDLERHLSSAHLDIRSQLCNICGKGFHRKSSLVEHVRTHTGERPYKCAFCDKTFTTKHASDSHEVLHTGEKRYKCDVCLREFASNSTLWQHKVTHTGERRYACTLCPKRFAASSTLKAHLLCHTGEKPYVCEICSRAFRSRNALTQHYLVHTKVKAFRCSRCDKEFAHANALKVHLRIHDGARPYACGVCKRGFSSIGTLREHEAMHTSERPFPCCECGKGSKTRRRLKEHVIVHNLNLEQHTCRASEGSCAFVRYKTFSKAKSHVCHECGKPFVNASKLMVHMVVHTKEKVCLCPLCGQGFSCTGSLKGHMRIHNGVMPYTCEFCGKQFAQSGNYSTHRTLHTGEKPFKCDICQETFRLRHVMRTHMRRSHGDQGPPKKTSPRKKKPLSKATKTSTESKELVIEDGEVPELHVIVPQYDNSDTSDSKASDSDADGGSEEQESVND